jgi:hypothetical protein
MKLGRKTVLIMLYSISLLEDRGLSMVHIVKKRDTSKNNEAISHRDE